MNKPLSTADIACMQLRADVACELGLEEYDHAVGVEVKRRTRRARAGR